MSGSRSAGVALLVIAIELAACSVRPPTSGEPVQAPASGSVVDGFPVGPAVPADSAGVALATRALDAREPGHAAIVDVKVYLEPGYLARSGAFSVYVFHLADGTYRATGVHCHPGGCDGYQHFPP